MIPHRIEFTGIVGTMASVSLMQVNQWAALACSLCTLVVIAPKAWEILKNRK